MGGEFKAFLPYLCSYGIKARFSCHHTHQQNGVAKRKHRHIVEMGLTLLAHAHMPLSFWVSTLQTVVYLINLLPSIAPLSCFIINSLTTLLFSLLATLVFPILGLIISTNLIFILLSVFLLGIVMITRGINAYIRQVEYMSPDMSNLTLTSFPILSFFLSLEKSSSVLNPSRPSTTLFHSLPSFSSSVPRVPQSIVPPLSNFGSIASTNNSPVSFENPTFSPHSSSSSSSSSSSPSGPFQPPQPPRTPKY